MDANDTLCLLKSSSSRAEGPEFEDLEDLGPMIVPLVAQRLTAYGDFFTVELCKKRQNSSRNRGDSY